MDREGLEQELRDYFQVEVKKIEPFSEWWDKAISRLTEQKHRSCWFGFMPKTRLAWVLLPLILLLIGGAAYGASSLIKDIFSKWAPHIENAGLAQELDLSETIDGVTVRLERVYADANAVLVGFTVSGTDERYSSHIQLFTTEGQNLPEMLGFGYVPESDEVLGEWHPTERLALVSLFDASSINGATSTINLHLEINAGLITTPPNIGEIQDSIGPFKFDFSVPFHAGKVVNVNQTVETKGVSITLERIVITPWATKAVFRFYPPDGSNKSGYLPIVSLNLPNGDIKKCNISKDMGFYSAQYLTDDLTVQPGEWIVTVNELVIMPDASGQKEGTHPASDTQRLTGPWIFHFQVP